MVALLLLLGQVQTRAWPLLSAEPEGLMLSISGSRGSENFVASPARARVWALGPEGTEPGTLIADKRMTRGMKVVLDRSSRSGWRTLSADISAAIKATYPLGPRTSLRFYLPAKQPESSDKALRKSWIGRRVWVLGAAAYGRNTIMWNPEEPVTILDITRKEIPVCNAAGNPAWNDAGGWGGGSFLTGSLLRIKLKVPKGAKTVDIADMNVNETTNDERHALPANEEAFIDVADGWQFARAFRTNSPSVVLAKESKRVRTAFHRRELVTGMPRTLVAFLFGDPNPSEPQPKVWSQKTWDWTGPTPFGFSITFNRSGRISSYGQYGELP